MDVAVDGLSNLSVLKVNMIGFIYYTFIQWQTLVDDSIGIWIFWVVFKPNLAKFCLLAKVLIRIQLKYCDDEKWYVVV